MESKHNEKIIRKNESLKEKEDETGSEQFSFH